MTRFRTLRWRSLKKGDLVDLVAPGYSAHEENLGKGILLLESWGLRVRRPQDLIVPFEFHAHTDAKRFEFLDRALRAKDSSAVWCVRGGYGANRLLPLLLKKKAPPQPKMFIGISDNTTLHFLLNQKWKWSTLHGPILERLGSGTLPVEFVEELRQLVFGELSEIVFADLEPLNKSALKKSKIQGAVLGGNLTTMQSLIGTALPPNIKDRILFLEDLGERGYRLDRMFEHFKQAQVLKGCKAIVFGHFLGGAEPGQPEKSFVDFALKRFAEDIKIPVFRGVDVGHGERQRTMPFLTKASIFKNQLQVDAGHVQVNIGER
ncbi:MAG: LD-carboxypeptidase [Bdellovibrio sp.]|jgi:muramoyltetrapeptide carboxypeptidase